jgi:hypothetical protein
VKARGTIALFALAAALGLYIWLVEIRGEAEREAQRAAEKRLVQVDSSEVTVLELPLEGGGHARLERVDPPEGESPSMPARIPAWRLTAPIEYAADADAVRRVLDAFADLSSLATIDDAADDTAIFGLDEDARATAVARAGDRELVRVYLGTKAPVGDATYAALASAPKRIVTVSNTTAIRLRPALLELREKRIAHLEAGDVMGFRVRAKGSPVVAARRADDDWWVDDGAVSTNRARADAARIDRLLGEMAHARALDFMDEPAPPARFGLAPPEVEIVLETAAGEQRWAFGRADGHVFLQVDAAHPVFEVRAPLLEGVPRDPFDYRHKQVSRIDESAVREIELAFPREDRRYVLARAKADEAQDAAPVEEWTARDASGRPVDLPALFADDLLFAIASLDATGIEADSSRAAALGLEPPSVRVVARDAHGAELGWLALGNLVEGRGVSARSSAGSELWWVKADIVEDVPLGHDALLVELSPKSEGSAAATDASGDRSE